MLHNNQHNNQQQLEVGTRVRLAEDSALVGDGHSRRACIYSGQVILRNGYDGTYELVIDPAGVSATRVDNGVAPLLCDHEDEFDCVIGSIAPQSLAVEDGKLFCEVKFADNEVAVEAMADAQAGHRRGVSMGLTVLEIKRVEAKDGKMRRDTITKSELLEVSLVPIPADSGAMLLSADGPVINLGAPAPSVGHADKPHKEVSMETTTPGQAIVPPDSSAIALAAQAAERSRVTEIHNIQLKFSIPKEVANAAINSGTTVDQFRATVLERLATDQDKTKTVSQSSAATISVDERDNFRVGLASALLMRANPNMQWDKLKPEDRDIAFSADAARQYRSSTLLMLAHEACRKAGINIVGESASRVVELAITGSDLPGVVADVANKSLRQAYSTAPATFRQVFRQSSAADFKNINRVQLAGQRAMPVTNDHGEVKFGRLFDSRETYRVRTFGERIPITRQTFVNDDIGAFTRLPGLLGSKVANTELDTVWGIITANGNMADGAAIFVAGASRGNNMVASGAALALGTLGTARGVMRIQKDLDGVTPLNLVPSFLVVPAALETTAIQLVSPIEYAPTTSATTRPEWVRNLQLIVEPRLDAASPSQWYLFADPSSIDTLEYAYLDGASGPRIEEFQTAAIDGMEMRVLHDFGAGMIDWRGAYRASA